MADDFRERLEEKLDDEIDGALGGLASKASWVPYSGPRGGSGWRNADTGDVVYDDDAPGESVGGEELEGALEEVLGEDAEPLMEGADGDPAQAMRGLAQAEPELAEEVAEAVSDAEGPDADRLSSEATEGFSVEAGGDGGVSLEHDGGGSIDVERSGDGWDVTAGDETLHEGVSATGAEEAAIDAMQEVSGDKFNTMEPEDLRSDDTPTDFEEDTGMTEADAGGDGERESFEEDFGSVQGYQVSSASSEMNRSGDKVLRSVREGNTHPGAAIEAAEQAAADFPGSDGGLQEYHVNSALSELKRGGVGKLERMQRNDQMRDGAARAALQEYADELEDAGSGAMDGPADPGDGVEGETREMPSGSPETSDEVSAAVASVDADTAAHRVHDELVEDGVATLDSYSGEEALEDAVLGAAGVDASELPDDPDAEANLVLEDVKDEVRDEVRQLSDRTGSGVSDMADFEEKLDDAIDGAFSDFSDGPAHKASWVPYEGPRGGSGYKNADTGEVTYDDSPPGGEVDQAAIEQMEGSVANRLQGASRDDLEEAYREMVGETPASGAGDGELAREIVDEVDEHRLAGLAQDMGAEVGAAAGSSGAIETSGTTTADAVAEGDPIVIDDTEAEVSRVSDMGGGMYVAARDDSGEVHTARVGNDHEFDVPASDDGGATATDDDAGVDASAAHDAARDAGIDAAHAERMGIDLRAWGEEDLETPADVGEALSRSGWSDEKIDAVVENLEGGDATYFPEDDILSGDAGTVEIDGEEWTFREDPSTPHPSGGYYTNESGDREYPQDVSWLAKNADDFSVRDDGVGEKAFDAGALADEIREAVGSGE